VIITDRGNTVGFQILLQNARLHIQMLHVLKYRTVHSTPHNKMSPDTGQPLADFTQIWTE